MLKFSMTALSGKHALLSHPLETKDSFDSLKCSLTAVAVVVAGKVVVVVVVVVVVMVVRVW